MWRSIRTFCRGAAGSRFSGKMNAISKPESIFISKASGSISPRAILCSGQRALRWSFRKFTGYWHLTPLRENACKIEFALHYEFASRLLEVLIGPVFHHIADTF